MRLGSFFSQKLQLQLVERVTALDLFTFFHTDLLQLAEVSWKLAFSPTSDWKMASQKNVNELNVFTLLDSLL